MAVVVVAAAILQPAKPQNSIVFKYGFKTIYVSILKMIYISPVYLLMFCNWSSFLSIAVRARSKWKMYAAWYIDKNGGTIKINLAWCVLWTAVCVWVCTFTATVTSQNNQYKSTPRCSEPTQRLLDDKLVFESVLISFEARVLKVHHLCMYANIDRFVFWHLFYSRFSSVRGAVCIIPNLSRSDYLKVIYILS